MRAVKAGPAGVTVVDAPEPSGPGVLVTVTSAGICGSDLHAVAAGAGTVILGHEFGGWTDGGTLVAVRPHRHCGQCSWCASGAVHLCPGIPEHFHGASVDGGLAERVLVMPDCLQPVPEGIDPAAVGLVEPIAVAWHAVSRGAPVAGERALVVGAGSVGLLCAAVLRDRGVAADIVARHPAQRDAAAAIGAGPAAEGHYDLVIDAAGTPGSFRSALRSCVRGGRVVLVGLPWEPLGVPMTAVLREVSVLPAVYYGRTDGVDDFAASAALLARHPELAEVLVTHRFPLDAAAEAFRAAGERAAGAIKVHLRP